MNRSYLLLACAGALLLAACTGDSQLPDPTGKGSVRALNAISGSPSTAFLIEERALGSLGYKESSSPSSFDDFDYAFNFDVALPGDSDVTRIATVAHKVEANRDHIFVLTGDPLNPTVTIWNADLREWQDSETSFEMRFAHLIDSRSTEAVDVYLDEAVTPQVVANRVATVPYGEVSALQDFETGDYVVTVTAANDVNTVLYTSPATTISARTTQTTAILDGDANDTSAMIANMMSAIGVERRLPDANSAPTLRFLHASFPLPSVDAYDDDTLTNRVVSGLAHGQSTVELAATGDTQDFFWTPQNSTATILLQGAVVAPTGARGIVSIVGATDEWVYFTFLLDRAPVSLYGKLQILQSALDNNVVDVYLLDAGATVGEDDVPIVRGLVTPLLVPAFAVQAGSYDLFVTTSGEQTVIAGPVRLDIANGDIADMMILDTADPAVAEIRTIPAP